MSDPHLLSAHGLRRVLAGDVEGLIELLQAAFEVTAPARDYGAILDSLRRAYERLDQPRALATLDFLQPESARRWSRASARLPSQDVARLHVLLGEHAQAAAAYEHAGWLAHAAASYERSGNVAAARSSWTRLSHRLAATDLPADAMLQEPARRAERHYVLGLVRYNMARTGAGRGPTDAPEVIVGAVSALGEAAQAFESLGLRERAFDCYEALAAIGTTTHLLEHVLEGRVNAIRILREDHLDQYALTQYRDAIEETTAAGELNAAAGFARDAWAFARSIDHAPEATGFVLQAIELQAAHARKLLRSVRSEDVDGPGAATRSAPVQLAEGLLRGAIALSAQAGLLGRARTLYLELAELPGLPPARRTRHLEAARALERRTDPAPALPRSAATKSPALEVWLVDVLEWEQGGRPDEVAGEILVESLQTAAGRNHTAALLLQRRALVCRLLAMLPDTPNNRVLLAQRLAEILDYRVLAMLEQLHRHPAPLVRAAAVEACESLPFKRSAQLLRGAARDPERVVLEAVERVVSRKRSPVFVDPLRRLAREAATPGIRLSALRALCFIDVAEAAEAVLDGVVAGTPPERRVILETLNRRRPDPQGPLARSIRMRLQRGLPPNVASELEALLPRG